MATEWLKPYTLLLASGVEAVAAIIIAVGVIEAVVRLVAMLIRRESSLTKNKVRLHFARWLAVGLEFLLAADILVTAVAPSWNEIGKLAAIAAIRTALNYFLEKEIDREEQRQDDRGTEGALA